MRIFFFLVVRPKPIKADSGLLRVKIPLFGRREIASGVPPIPDVFGENVWSAPHNGLFSPPAKTGILCQTQ
jgi:hypothetical protein